MNIEDDYKRTALEYGIESKKGVNIIELILERMTKSRLLEVKKRMNAGNQKGESRVNRGTRKKIINRETLMDVAESKRLPEELERLLWDWMSSTRARARG